MRCYVIEKLVMTDKVSMIVVAKAGPNAGLPKAGRAYQEYPHLMMNAGASALEIPKNVRDITININSVSPYIRPDRIGSYGLA